MYYPQQIKELQSLSTEFIKNPDINIANIEQLRNILRFHEYRYYVQNDPLISDYEFDILYKQLEKVETQNPDFVTTDSPTQRVGKGLIKSFPKVQHLVPMLSLENSYNEDDLLDWDRKAKELSGLPEIEYCIEPKFDGASISLVYENDLLVRGATRGDGETGDDITPNIKQIRSLPLSAPFSKYGIEQIEIRGEVLMSKNNFKNYNQKLVEDGMAPLANPRNAAAGTLRMKDPAIVSKRNLEAFLYQVSFKTRTEGRPQTADHRPQTTVNRRQIFDDDHSSHQSSTFPPLTGEIEGATHSSTLEMLYQLGFRSPKKEMKVVKGIEAVMQYIHLFESKREELPYEIDGMVIKVNDNDLQEKMGNTSHHPRWAIAYKFKARQATSKLLAVTYQVGRTGAVTPVAKIEAVQVGGVTVQNISIHNEDYIKEKDLKIGDTILIERSGDVIPQIVKSLPELRTGKEKDIIYPKECPVCHDKLFKTEDEAVWRCININCKAQVVERIIHFVSKDAMDLRSFGEANVRKFYEMGLLKDIPGIYKIDFDKMKNLEGFGEKSIDNLQQAIENSKTQPLHRLIYALGIRYVGETTAKALAQNITHIMDLKDLSIEQLQQMDDVGVKVANSIFEFFANEDNQSILQKLEQVGVQMKKGESKIQEGNLNGQTFLFTGSLQKLKRTEAEEMVEANGGKILGSVSSKLNYLVVGEDAGSKLDKAKKIPAIKIISEEDFLKLLPE